MWTRNWETILIEMRADNVENVDSLDSSLVLEWTRIMTLLVPPGGAVMVKVVA